MNKNLPKRKNLRLKDFDYSLPGSYFITIVIQDRMNLFGDVIEGKMCLNEAGKGVEQLLEQITVRFEGVKIPYHVVMPNHIHFILFISGGINLSEIIRTFKSISTQLYIKGVKTLHWPPFHQRLWQHNYYEHIIRNQRSFDFIANYIVTNPLHWAKDAINLNHEEECEQIMKTVLEYE